MTWNYRIIDHGDWLGLHEVHYDEQGTPRAYAEHAYPFVADKEEGVEGIIASLTKALADARGHEVLGVGAFGAE